MSKLYLLFGVGGAGLAAAGTGVGIYYGTQQPKETKEKVPDGEVDPTKGSEEQGSENQISGGSSSLRTDGPSGPVLPAPPA